MNVPMVNHSEYIAKTKKMDEASLRYVIKDCQEAIKAMPDNPKSGYYQDEICYCSMELNRRRNLRK
jgi:hypothetical protein